MPTTRKIELINKKDFIKQTLDENIPVFIVHVSSLSRGLKMTIYPAKKAQIVLLLAKKVTIQVKYSDFANVFSEKLANIFPEQTGANKHTIELEQGKRPPYKPIYSLKPVELETFKTYIKTNLANGFIRASKSPAGTLILFV